MDSMCRKIFENVQWKLQNIDVAQVGLGGTCLPHMRKNDAFWFDMIYHDVGWKMGKPTRKKKQHIYRHYNQCKATTFQDFDGHQEIHSIPFRMMPPGLSQLLQDELSFYLFDSIPQQHSPGDDSATWQQKCSGDAPALRATTKIT